SSGPIAPPALPPSWKTDCATPLFPPDARWASLDDLGWKMDEPTPMMATAMSTLTNVEAIESRITPQRVNVIPVISEYGLGLRSVTRPTTGCSRDAVIWKVNVISPICVKLRWKICLSNG